MTRTPHYEPDPEDIELEEIETTAMQRIQDLLQLTQEIQLQSQNPDLPALSQLIFQREAMIEALSSHHWQALSDERRDECLQVLLAVQNLDPAIEAQMQHVRQKLETQLQQLKTGQTLIGKYKSPPSTEQGTHSQEA
jgi:hypothetical protein